MRKTLWKVGLTTAAVVLLSSSSAYAQTTANAALAVNVTVASRARLTLSAGINLVRGRRSGPRIRS